jgi:hypothetical protein
VLTYRAAAVVTEPRVDCALARSTSRRLRAGQINLGSSARCGARNAPVGRVRDLETRTRVPVGATARALDPGLRAQARIRLGLAHRSRVSRPARPSRRIAATFAGVGATRGMAPLLVAIGRASS